MTRGASVGAFLAIALAGCASEKPAPVDTEDTAAVELQPPAIDICTAYGGPCVLLDEGRVACWGQYPDDPWVADLDAVRLDCAAGGCAESADGGFTCWPGQSAADNEYFLPPTAILPLSDWRMNSTDGTPAACGTSSSSGEVSCWPSNPFADVAVSAADVSFTAACELTLDAGGRIFAWVLGADCASEPEWADGIEAVPAGDGWSDVEGGFYHACALDAEGRATCWGDNADEWPPPSDDRFTQLSADMQSTCGVTTDGFLRCWAGEAWDDWGVDWNEGWMPESAPTTAGWVKVDVQTHYACAIDIRGQVHCFGDWVPRGSLADALANPVDTPPNSAYLPPPE